MYICWVTQNVEQLHFSTIFKGILNLQASQNHMDGLVYILQASLTNTQQMLNLLLNY